ncbi:MAG: beta-ketoacyl synthase [Pseudomonadales bacterium]
MPAKLPVIVGFGGINPAGRLSFHHAYRRKVIDALGQAQADRTYASLGALMGCLDQATTPEGRQKMLDGTLIRRIDDPENRQMSWHTRLGEAADGAPLKFTLAKRQLPDPLPADWQVQALDERNVQVTFSADAVLYAKSQQNMKVTSAGQLPNGFAPGALYQSRNHPRGLQITVFAASDTLRSSGLDLALLKSKIAPDQFAVFSGSAMGQLDNDGYGGMYQNSLTGRRPTAKNVPLGLAEMPGDFINAYVLGSVGDTAGIIGACATYLYNLKQGAEAIATGHKRIVMIGNAEAPIVPEVMEGYRTMGALAEDEALMALDNSNVADQRRACRPFSSNAGFTVAESGVYTLLMDDELALELGAQILGSVGGVFANADGFKKSIPGPGVGNYLTMGKALGLARSVLGEQALRSGTHVQAHGTGTPQNRVTESEILSRLAGTFGINNWPVAAIKAYVGHSMAPAGGDQLAAVLGSMHDGWLPGITTIDHIADDVCTEHLTLPMEHLELAPEQRQAALINSKGFGGNNATGLVFSPAWTRNMLASRWGKKHLLAYDKRAEACAESAQAYDDAMCKETQPSIYQFGEGVLEGSDLTIDAHQIQLPGFDLPVSLDLANPYADDD